jgi:hypothetical protein
MTTMDQRTALASAFAIVKPMIRDGFQFGSLERFQAGDGSDVYGHLTLRHSRTRETVDLHLRATPAGYELAIRAPEDLPPYGLPEIAARPDEPVFLVGDVRTAKALVELGVLATAAFPRPDWTDLAGRLALVWPALDDDWVPEVAPSLIGGGVQVELIETAKAGCVDEWLAAKTTDADPGQSRPELLSLPRMRPQERTEPPDTPEVIQPDETPAAADLTRPGRIREAMDFLRDVLVGVGRPSAEIREQATTRGLSWRTVQAAATRLGVDRQKVGMRGGWVWRLPSPTT